MERLKINITGDNILKAGNNVLGSPFVSTQLFGSLSGIYKWAGGVLAPNGKIYGIPLNSTQVLEIDKSTITKQPAIVNILPDPVSVLAASNYNRYQNKF